MRPTPMFACKLAAALCFCGCGIFAPPQPTGTKTQPATTTTGSGGSTGSASNANANVAASPNAAAAPTTPATTAPKTPASSGNDVGQAAGAGSPSVPSTPNLGMIALTNDTSSVGGSPRSYSGPAINFPNDPNRWDTWAQSWSRAAAQLPSSNTATQNQWLQQAILLEAATTGMDARFILAVVMQESGGDVHVRTTNNGVNNPGLMQSHDGASFSDNGDGGKASIFQMIQDGCRGTAKGDGLLQGAQKSHNYFAAGRLYNSGALDDTNLSNPLGATASYCQDLANRVMGRM